MKDIYNESDTIKSIRMKGIGQDAIAMAELMEDQEVMYPPFAPNEPISTKQEDTPSANILGGHGRFMEPSPENNDSFSKFSTGEIEAFITKPVPTYFINPMGVIEKKKTALDGIKDWATSKTGQTLLYVGGAVALGGALYYIHSKRKKVQTRRKTLSNILKKHQKERNLGKLLSPELEKQAEIETKKLEMEIRSAQKTETVLNWASGLGGSIGGYILSRKLGALTIIPAIGASLCGTLWDIPALTFTGVGIAVGNGVNFLSKQPGSVKSISSSTSTQTTLPKQPIQLIYPWQKNPKLIPQICLV
jgi:hypothetical protein